MVARRIRWTTGVTLVSCCALVASAAGQYPVYQDGHALDANPALGQFRRNTANPQQLMSPPNFVVTGNVTAGRSFRAFSPIRDFSSFAFTVPSGGLSFFNRDTVGIDQVLGSGGAPITPSPFFAPEQTIPSAGAIVTGLTPPGFNTLPRTDLNPNLTFENLGIPPGSTMYQPLQDTRILPTGNAIRPETLPSIAPLSPYLPVTESFVNPVLVESPLLATNPTLSRRAGSRTPTPFELGGPDLGRSADLTGSYLDISGRGTALQETDAQGANGAGLDIPPPSQPIDPRVDARQQAATQLLDERVDFRQDPTDVFQLADRAAPGVSQPGAAAPGAGDQPARPAIGTFPAGTWIAGQAGPGTYALRPQAGGVFAQMTEAVASLTAPAAPAAQRESLIYQPAADTEQAFARPISPGGRAAEAGAGEYVEPRGAGAAAAVPAPEAAEPPVAAHAAPTSVSAMTDLVEPRGLAAEELLNRPVTTFVGAEDTRLNHYLRQAESFLDSGEYFRAAGQYKLAALIDPDNPLVWLGQGHALIAAGDYASAVRALGKGIERFPQIAYFRLSLNDFIPDATLLESRRADLEARLATEESAEARFLLGYVEYYSGLQSYGLENLKKAAALSPADSAIARFAAMLETSPNRTRSGPE